ncbi:M-phase phosphoprotein 8, partial [Tetranychus urticae]|uniref:M-phase phosphoprotein 8 n=1 Tax=Tetranychus urticae TaxID=32264 RepID=UPI00077C08DE
ASQNGHYDIVRSLLLHGANFSIINDAGSNALRTAKLFGNDETQHILTKHVSQITMALENQVIELLRSTARISHALFPIQCHSTSENLRFRLLFNFDSIEPFQPGIGFLLFISDLTFSLFKPVSLRFFSPSAKVKVYLNGTLQKSLTEGAKFVFSFTPLRRGVNELLLTIKESQSRQCFIICAYQVTLINSKP